MRERLTGSIEDLCMSVRRDPAKGVLAALVAEILATTLVDGFYEGWGTSARRRA